METVAKKNNYEGMFLVDSARAGSDWDGIIAAIKKIRGIEDETRFKSHSVRDIKKQIKTLKQEKIRLREEGAYRKTIDNLRRRISHLKKMTRRAA